MASLTEFHEWLKAKSNGNYNSYFSFTPRGYYGHKGSPKPQLFFFKGKPRLRLDLLNAYRDYLNSIGIEYPTILTEG